MGSRDEPHVGTWDPPVAHALERRVLQRPEELDLQLGWDVSHLVEKQRAPLGLLDVPGPIAHGPGHGTADMPEQLALEQGAADRSAVHLDEGPPAAGTLLVNSPGE